MPSGRPLLVASVDDETRDQWRTFAALHGVSVSGLIEALGRMLDGKRPPSWQATAIGEARAIDAERRARS